MTAKWSRVDTSTTRPDRANSHLDLQLLLTFFWPQRTSRRVNNPPPRSKRIGPPLYIWTEPLEPPTPSAAYPHRTHRTLRFFDRPNPLVAWASSTGCRAVGPALVLRKTTPRCVLNPVLDHLPSSCLACLIARRSSRPNRPSQAEADDRPPSPQRSSRPTGPTRLSRQMDQ